MVASRIPVFFSSIICCLIPAWVSAQDPWAVEVLSYDPGSGAAFNYDQTPEVALGRPSVDTYAFVGEEVPSVPVVPVYSAWSPLELVSIGEGGHLELRLGRPVTDHSGNPYGIDLLVFAYTFLTGAGSYDQVAGDPETYTLAGSSGIGLYGEFKAGRVELSADRSSWVGFSSSPDLPALLPSLGRQWTGTEWGEPTDPTFPPDPSLSLSDLAGMNLAELCRRYRGGAGGAGFDLAHLDISGGEPGPFSYLRISVPDDGDPETELRIEIDAVTVVQPVDGYTRWVQRQFAWVEDPDREAPDANPDTDPFSNWQEFGRGGDPETFEAQLWKPVLEPAEAGLRFQLPVSAQEAPWRVQISDTAEEGFDWKDLTPAPVPVDVTGGVSVTRILPVPVESAEGVAYFRLMLEAAP